ncbi:MAG: UDP-2,3-diacylglucosamine diphosphatase [Betaproteobacteria bacterium]|nr:UDP-2,3-diacylglucosamine diphosphatase [Betaproteobacteria bacterium]
MSAGDHGLGASPPSGRAVPHTLFIADLHLCAEHPQTTRIFKDFLRNTAIFAESLYILGDLFEYWAGDDDLTDPHHAGVASALAELSRGGTAVFIMRGNRDFLIGDKFAQAAQARIASDPTLTDLYGTPTLLTHGDTLCSGDTGYLAFRDKVRAPSWQSAFLARPLAERKAEIEALRQRSEADKSLKSEAEMDAQPDAVAAALREHGYPRLIHGHTHRPARHLHQIDGHDCERWVLGSWHDHGSYLHCDASGCRAIRL